LAERKIIMTEGSVNALFYRAQNEDEARVFTCGMEYKVHEFRFYDEKGEIVYSTDIWLNYKDRYGTKKKHHGIFITNVDKVPRRGSYHKWTGSQEFPEGKTPDWSKREVFAIVYTPRWEWQGKFVDIYIPIEVLVATGFTIEQQRNFEQDRQRWQVYTMAVSPVGFEVFVSHHYEENFEALRKLLADKIMECTSKEALNKV
jgi:hypothetical protein